MADGRNVLTSVGLEQVRGDTASGASEAEDAMSPDMRARV